MMGYMTIFPVLECKFESTVYTQIYTYLYISGCTYCMHVMCIGTMAFKKICILYLKIIDFLIINSNISHKTRFIAVVAQTM